MGPMGSRRPEIRMHYIEQLLGEIAALRESSADPGYGLGKGGGGAGGGGGGAPPKPAAKPPAKPPAKPAALGKK